MKLLSSLARSAHLPQPQRDVRVSGISMDSRTIKEGELFCALHADHIHHAISRGASSILCSPEASLQQYGVPVLITAQLRKAISVLSAAFYDYPSKRIALYGVTGTNGKSSTAGFIHQLLTHLGHRSCIISGAWRDSLHQDMDSPILSTPEAPMLHKLLHRYAAAGCTHGSIEITSHALSEKNYRCADVELSGAVYTAMGRDHLDFHPTIDAYHQVKCSMICQCAPGSPVILDAASPLVPLLPPGVNTRLLGKDIRIISSHSDCAVLEGFGMRKELRLPSSPGYLQENMLLAVTALWDQLTAESDLTDVFHPPPGRGETIMLRDNRQVIIDYAHNPEALERVLSELPSHGQILAVCGAAGERDRGKRLLMGTVLDRWTHRLFLTEEDPFGEDPLGIIRDILAGISAKKGGSTLFIHPRRESAISHALSTMNPGDILLLLGKGHEDAIRYSSSFRWWNEREILLSLARDLQLGVG